MKNVGFVAFNEVFRADSNNDSIIYCKYKPGEEELKSIRSIWRSAIIVEVPNNERKFGYGTHAVCKDSSDVNYLERISNKRIAVLNI